MGRLIGRFMRAALTLLWLAALAFVAWTGAHLHNLDKPTSVLLMAVIAFAAIFTSWLLFAWLLSRRLGPIQSRLRWSTSRTVLLCSVSTIYTGTSLFWLPMASQRHAGSGLAYVATIASLCMAGYHLLRLLQGIELRQRGIAADLIVAAWQNVRDYEWVGEERTTLRLHIKPSPSSLWSKQIDLPLATGVLDSAAAFLNDRVGQRAKV